MTTRDTFDAATELTKKMMEPACAAHMAVLVLVIGPDGFPIQVAGNFDGDPGFPLFAALQSLQSAEEADFERHHVGTIQ